MNMSIPNKKDALGKGIRSLLQNIDADLTTTASNLQKESPGKFSPVNMRIPLNMIEANPDQPRHDFDENSLERTCCFCKNA